jgi:hypothetical protein
MPRDNNPPAYHTAYFRLTSKETTGCLTQGKSAYLRAAKPHKSMVELVVLGAIELKRTYLHE